MASGPASPHSNPDAIQRSHWLRTALIALGLSDIASFWMAGAVISPLHLTVYHWSGSALALFAPVWLDLVASWIVASLLLYSMRLGRLWRRVVWVGILVALPAVAVMSIRLGLSNRELTLGVVVANPHPLLHLWLYVLTPLAWITLLVFWRPSFDRYLENAVRFGEVVLTFSGIAGAALFAQLAWCNWQAAGLNYQPALHVQATTQAAKPRIVWLVLDELSYQQVYEQRYSGLALPAFDRLAQESAVFTQVIPAGFDTDRILPALIAGRPVENIRSNARGELWTHEQRSSEWQSYNQHDTVFEDALERGYSTGVSGWWNPYCRILSVVLDHCYWTGWFLEHKGFSEDASASTKLKATLARAMNELAKILPGRLKGLLTVFATDDRMRLAETYQDIAQHGDSLLTDPSATFVMVHVPIPHPVGIFNRATGQLTAQPTSYIDNLALCDLYLAHVRSELEQRGEWDSTTLVLMGDHGWRTGIWKTNAWDATDEAASNGGKFDTRPGYIVKLPNQRQGTRINAPFHALQTRSLFDALMSGQVRTASDLEAWVQAHP